MCFKEVVEMPEKGVFHEIASHFPGPKLCVGPRMGCKIIVTIVMICHVIMAPLPLPAINDTTSLRCRF